MTNTGSEELQFCFNVLLSGLFRISQLLEFLDFCGKGHRAWSPTWCVRVCSGDTRLVRANSSCTGTIHGTAECSSVWSPWQIPGSFHLEFKALSSSLLWPSFSVCGLCYLLGLREQVVTCCGEIRCARLLFFISYFGFDLRCLLLVGWQWLNRGFSYVMVVFILRICFSWTIQYLGCGVICIKDVACTEMKLKIKHCLNRES